jgi:hypothetical protein
MIAKRRVFADTNVILEAFRIGCWKVVAERFAKETVEKCREEALSGNPDAPGFIRIPPLELDTLLAKVHSVGKLQIATIGLALPQGLALDAGERDLFAWLQFENFDSETDWVATTSDRAAIRAAHHLGWLDKLISLEELAHKSGVGTRKLDAMKRHYRADWLENAKVTLRLG